MPRKIDVEHLFETVVQMFAQRGYNGTTTQEIAVQAGVNEVTLFRRYGTKAKLLESALVHVLSNSPFGKMEFSGELREDLFVIVGSYRETNRMYSSSVFTLLHELPSHPELSEAKQILKANMARAAMAIVGFQQRGLLSSGDPFKKLVFLLSPLMMNGLWNRAASTEETMELTLEEVVDSFLKGHGSKTTSL